MFGNRKGDPLRESKLLRKRRKSLKGEASSATVRSHAFHRVELRYLMVGGAFNVAQFPVIGCPAKSFFTNGTESISEALTVPP